MKNNIPAILGSQQNGGDWKAKTSNPNDAAAGLQAIADALTENPNAWVSTAGENHPYQKLLARAQEQEIDACVTAQKTHAPLWILPVSSKGALNVPPKKLEAALEVLGTLSRPGGPDHALDASAFPHDGSIFVVATPAGRGKITAEKCREALSELAPQQEAAAQSFRN